MFYSDLYHMHYLIYIIQINLYLRHHLTSPMITSVPKPTPTMTPSALLVNMRQSMMEQRTVWLSDQVVARLIQIITMVLSLLLPWYYSSVFYAFESYLFVLYIVVDIRFKIDFPFIPYHSYIPLPHTHSLPFRNSCFI
ncbi:hypothetical protein BCR42DRAFT_422729 [Absidia repens]|uniref:Uncharacterized protein n=1 Tax=Absidia repens TaxID=90262 RepID=A0A1X2I7F4_9FUNG|nr:hypothetical protein BCR42DRAFT_422729 [Absidia repens]